MIIKVKNWYFVKTLYEYGDVHVMPSLKQLKSSDYG